MKTEIEIKIRGYHVDQFHHVNNARYLEFLEEGRWDFLENNHLFSALHLKNISHSVVNIQINYRRSVAAGQIIKVETALLKRSPKSITMKQRLFVKDSKILVADAEVTSVFLDRKSGEVLPVNGTFFRVWPELSSLPEEDKFNQYNGG